MQKSEKDAFIIDLHVIGVYATNRLTISLSVSGWPDKVKYLISGNLPKVDDSYRDIYAPNGNKSLVALNTKKAVNLRKRPAVSGCV